MAVRQNPFDLLLLLRYSLKNHFLPSIFPSLPMLILLVYLEMKQSFTLYLDKVRKELTTILHAFAQSTNCHLQIEIICLQCNQPEPSTDW